MEKFIWKIQTCGLEKLTSEEFYYIISSLLGLGDPGFVPEKLYLSFDEQSIDLISTVRFLLITSTLNEFETEAMEYHLGAIDREFDEIEIYSCRSEQSKLSSGTIVADFIASVQGRIYPKVFRPITLLRGIERIVSRPDFEKRKDNQLFEFFESSPIPEGTKYYFDFGKIGPLNTNFSGNYYLIAQPDSSDSNSAEVSSFQIHDNYDRKNHTDYVQLRIDVRRSFVNSESIQLYDQGLTENISRKELNSREENFDNHKANMIPVLTQTVLALLNDLSPTTKRNLLEDETPEELIEYCKEKYDREFDLNADSMGIAGAHEIAWAEALAILKDDQIEFNLNN